MRRRTIFVSVQKCRFALAGVGCYRLPTQSWRLALTFGRKCRRCVKCLVLVCWRTTRWTWNHHLPCSRPPSFPSSPSCSVIPYVSRVFVSSSSRARSSHDIRRRPVRMKISEHNCLTCIINTSNHVKGKGVCVYTCDFVGSLHAVA